MYPPSWSRPYWRVIHTTAFIADTVEPYKYDQATKAIQTICQHLPCGACRKHATAFISGHPFVAPTGPGQRGIGKDGISEIERILKTGSHEEQETVEQLIQQKLPLWTWTWKFHNAVNQRLRRPTWSAADAFREFHVEALDSEKLSAIHAAQTELTKLHAELRVKDDQLLRMSKKASSSSPSTSDTSWDACVPWIIACVCLSVAVVVLCACCLIFGLRWRAANVLPPPLPLAAPTLVSAW